MLDCAFSMLPDILVGFEQILTTVDEDIGSFELCIRIFTNHTLLPEFNISLDLSTVAGTAGMLRGIDLPKQTLRLLQLQIPVTTLNSILPIVLLCPSPMTLQPTDNVSMSLSTRTKF